MYGGLITSVVNCLGFIAGIYGLHERRIPNGLALAALVLALALKQLSARAAGLRQSALGMGLKFVAAIGALVEPMNWLGIFFFTGLLGGILCGMPTARAPTKKIKSWTFEIRPPSGFRAPASSVQTLLRLARLTFMQLLLRASLPLFVAGAIFGQLPPQTLPPSGNNQKASVSQFIGPAQVTIDYSSPAVHSPTGQDRRGQIWGKLVPYGMADLAFNQGKLSPWRAGANENTVFAVSHPSTIEGQPLPAGRYGLHMIPGADEWTIIFSKNSAAWGSFFYDESEDALRVKVKPRKHDYREWLTYEFTVRRPTESTVELQWEELAVPWSIRVPNADDIYISRIRQQLTDGPGFSYQSYTAAAQYCVQSGTHLEDALKWADTAINMPLIGQTNFDTLSTKALVLAKLGRQAEAKTIMQTALNLPGTTAVQIHMYGRQLQAAKKNDEAMEVFKLNAERNGDAWPVHVGLARAYSAAGDPKKALEHAQKALPQAPDNLNRQSLESMIKALSEGQTIN